MNNQPQKIRILPVAFKLPGLLSSLLFGSLCSATFAATSPDDPPSIAPDVGAITAPTSATVQRGYRHHESVRAPVAPTSHPSKPQAQVLVLNSNAQKQARIEKR